MATIGALGSTIGSIAIYFVALKLGKRVFKAWKVHQNGRIRAK
jgi:membrane protein YqaA with SNARE-associated domain